MLIWRCLLRRGDVRTLVRESLVADTDTPHLKILHRSETDIPFKKKGDGERCIGLKPETVAAIEDYIDTHRRTPIAAYDDLAGTPAPPDTVKRRVRRDTAMRQHKRVSVRQGHRRV